MKSLGDQALKKIQNLIVAKDPRPSTSPKKQKSLATFRPSKIVQEDNKKKSPSSKYLNLSPSKKSTTVYIPRERQIRLLQKQTKIIYKQLSQRANFKMQNPHSFFLNEKNPKPPIYERAQDIVRQREMALEEKRKEKMKEKEEAEEREYEQFLKAQLNKKTHSKEQAFIASDRLYKQHYSKANRLNQKKIERYKEESKNFREKPLINSVSKQIYNVVAEKNKLQTDIIDRFGQYQIEKTEKHKQTEQKYKNKYLPFKPVISDNSKMINSAREEKSIQMGKSSHCLSCNFIKGDYKATSPSRSPAKSYIFEQT